MVTKTMCILRDSAARSRDFWTAASAARLLRSAAFACSAFAALTASALVASSSGENLWTDRSEFESSHAGLGRCRRVAGFFCFAGVATLLGAKDMTVDR